MPVATRAPYILVIEDNPDIRRLITRLLRGEGFRTAEAVNGRDALALLASADEKPRLILLDLMMPVQDGFDFVREQMLSPDLAGIPVVVLSADRRMDTRRDEVPAVGYLGKPINMDTLLAVLERFCGFSGPLRA